MTHLMAAAAAGQVDIVESLLSSPGIGVDETTDTGERALTMACVNGHLEVVKILVGAGARVEEQTGDKLAPLHGAFVGRHLQVVKYLVEEAGVDERRPGRDGRTPLMLAVENGHADMVKYLLGRPSVDVDQTTFTGRRALIIACFQGYLEVVKLLVGAGARVNPQGSSEWGPLLEAISGRHLQVVKYLMEETGADVQHVGPWGYTPLMAAAFKGHIEIMEYLLGRQGIDVDEMNMSGQRALTEACANGHLEAVKLLVAAGARVETQTGEQLGLGPLITAALRGHLEVVKYLVEEAGADVIRVDPDGWRPVVPDKRYTDMVEYLRPLVTQRKEHEEQRKQHEEQRKQREEFQRLQAAEARAAAAAAALLEEEDREAAAKGASSKKKKKKGKKKGGAAAPTHPPSPPSQEQLPNPTLEPSENSDDTQALAAVLASSAIDDAGLEGRREGESTGGASAVVTSTGPNEDMGYAGVSSQAVGDKEAPSEAMQDLEEAAVDPLVLEGLSCPISLQLMTHAVMADDGHTYQQHVIQQWIDKCTADKRPVTSPLTGAPMGTGLRPNLLARSMVRNLAATKSHGT